MAASARLRRLMDLQRRPRNDQGRTSSLLPERRLSDAVRWRMDVGRCDKKMVVRGMLQLAVDDISKVWNSRKHKSGTRFNPIDAN